jgi:acyl carrier protein
MERAGMFALSAEEGLDLFDAAYSLGEPLIMPARLKMAELRMHARTGFVAPLLRALIRTPARVSAGPAGGSMVRRLANVPEQERGRVVLNLVRGEVAAVLGHASPDAVEPDRAFNELGFDSLAAMDLRNRLAGASGLQLSATLVFDYPTAVALSEFLLTQLSSEIGESSEEGLSEADIREALSAIPLSRLREAGVMDTLLGLAGIADASRGQEREDAVDSIDEAEIDVMDIDKLVRMTLEPDADAAPLEYAQAPLDVASHAIDESGVRS